MNNDIIKLFPGKFTRDPVGLLVRGSDDFLYATESKNLALEFKERMLKGFPEFNFFIRNEKTESNLDETNSTCSEVGFCGTLFNVDTLETRMDLSSYSGLNVAHALMFNLGEKESKER